MDARANNFDLLRLLFASAVVVYHLAALPDQTPLAALRGGLARGADLGVKGFFIISGCLVYLSYIRTKSLARFATKRVRRLYPAYVVVVALSGLASLILGVRSWGEASHLASYLAANLAFLNFLEPTAPGLFEGHPHGAVNGALWTIKIEVMFYLALPAIAWMLARARARAGGAGVILLCGLIYAGAEVWRMGFEARGLAEGAPIYAQLARQLPGQMSYFISGLMIAIFGERLLARPQTLLAVLAVSLLAFVASLTIPAAAPLQAAGLAGLVLLAARRTPPLYDAARRGDYSYGIYIVHFPVIQALVAAGAFAAAPAAASLAAVAAAAAAAFLLWRRVERPFLLASSHYRGGD